MATEEPTTSSGDRFAAIERQMVEQQAELERLRAHDPVRKAEAALHAPRLVSPDALAREARDLAAIRARQEALEAHAQAVAEQAERDRPRRERRDARVEELRERRDQAVADADRLYLEADKLSDEMAVILRKPLSAEIPLPEILRPAPVASWGVTATNRGTHVQVATGAAAKLNEGQR